MLASVVRRPARVRVATLAMGVVAAVGPLAGCGDDAGGGDAEPSAVRTAGNGDVFNDADVRFATEMVPHHAQAIEMVTLADGRPLDPEVAEVAEQVRAAQAPEVESMVDWLTAWGEEVPETSLDHANADHGDGEEQDGHDTGAAADMPGMMSAEEMTALEEAPDAEFQDLWLEMMIEHHRGAIEMARAEQADGEFADALALADSIVASQQDEVELMESLLGS